jgi:hypothetical protein
VPKEAGHDLQWASHVHDAVSRSDITHSFECIEDPAVVHKVVEAEVTERKGWLESMHHSSRMIDVLRTRELRDLGRGGEKKCKEGVAFYVLKSRAKFNERSPIFARLGLCQ